MLIILGFVVLGALAVGIFALMNHDPRAEEQVATIDYLSVPLTTITGEEVSLKSFEGKVVLLVNTASKCGYTPQYKNLEEIYRKYKDDGLVVLGVPANNFMNQEPGSNEEIMAFCRTEYDVTFPMLAKISVKGDDIHPLYDYLTNQSPFPGKISWNFNKFLIGRDGTVIDRFGTKVNPSDEELTSKIEMALGK